MPTARPPARRRHAATTRSAILASARRAFVRAGYDGAGVREIAAGAGVTAMLVNRYFGSKERLFGEVVAGIQASPQILSAAILRSRTPGEDMARALVEVTASGATPLDGFLIMIRSASSERAAAIGSAQIDHHYQRLLTSALRGDRAPQRAAVILALVAGLQVMRQVMALPALAKADPADLIRILAPVLQLLVDGEPRRNRGVRRDR
jgi:AcrR family transcriptional regulator